MGVLLKAAVVGAGICGLTAAEALLERGHDVTVYASEFQEETTSRIATALLFPYAVPPTEQVRTAARGTLAYFRLLADRGVGINYQRHFHLSSSADVDTEIAPFADVYDECAQLAASEIPGAYAHGWSLRTYFVDSRKFMPWLQARLVAGGARIVTARFGDRDEMLAVDADVIVNCAGLAAGPLFDDPCVYPVKGQLVYMERASVDYSVIHDGYYLLPRDDSCVLGGTKESGAWDTSTDDRVTAAIIAANQRFDPTLTPDRFIRASAGLRPCRDGGPRLEVEDIAAKRVIHNYGHGGSGWTLAAGYAQLVADML